MGQQVAHQKVSGLSHGILPGEYYLYKGGCCEDDNVLNGFTRRRLYLLRKVVFVESDIFAVEVMLHPSESAHESYVRVRIDEFVRLFALCPDGQKARDAEILALEKEIAMDHARAKSCLDMVAGMLPQEASPAFLLGQEEASATEVLSQIVVKKKKMESYEKESQEISKKIEASRELLLRFYKEKSVAMIASMEASVEAVNRINEAVATVEFYTGEKVEVVQHAAGIGASPETPLVLRQRLLYLQDEWFVNNAFYGKEADAYDIGSFCKALANDAQLRDRVIPESRCLVAMKSRHDNKMYNDPVLGVLANNKSRETFLLVRDGENIYTIHSPLTDLGNLFPSKNDLKDPFVRYGKLVTSDSLWYPESKEKSRKQRLMYERLLLLVAGAQDREGVFGQFAESSVNFFSPDFQSRWFRLIYDAENDLLLGAGNDYKQWLNKKNAFLTIGSVIAVNEQCLDELIAEKVGRNFCCGGELVHEVVEINDVACIAFSAKRKFGGRRGKRVTLDLSAICKSCDFVCLDGVFLSDVESLLFSREWRHEYGHLVGMYIAAVKSLREEGDWSNHEIPYYRSLKRQDVRRINDKKVKRYIEECEKARKMEVPNRDSFLVLRVDGDGNLFAYKESSVMSAEYGYLYADRWRWISMGGGHWVPVDTERFSYDDASMITIWRSERTPKFMRPIDLPSHDLLDRIQRCAEQGERRDPGAVFEVVVEGNKKGKYVYNPLILLAKAFSCDSLDVYVNRCPAIEYAFCAGDAQLRNRIKEWVSRVYKEPKAHLERLEEVGRGECKCCEGALIRYTLGQLLMKTGSNEGEVIRGF